MLHLCASQSITCARERDCPARLITHMPHIYSFFFLIQASLAFIKFSLYLQRPSQIFWPLSLFSLVFINNKLVSFSPWMEDAMDRVTVTP